MSLSHGRPEQRRGWRCTDGVARSFKMIVKRPPKLGNAGETACATMQINNLRKRPMAHA
jgi:hypothetical protein